MRHVARHLIVALSLALSACKATTQLPLRTEQIRVLVSVDQLVCHVRGIAAEQRLSFHYGTFTDQTGPRATFRLIGDVFELELVKWGAQSSYELRAYDMSKNASAGQAADRAFERFRTTLTEQLRRKCAS